VVYFDKTYAYTLNNVHCYQVYSLFNILIRIYLWIRCVNHISFTQNTKPSLVLIWNISSAINYRIENNFKTCRLVNGLNAWNAARCLSDKSTESNPN